MSSAVMLASAVVSDAGSNHTQTAEEYYRSFVSDSYAKFAFWQNEEAVEKFVQCEDFDFLMDAHTENSSILEECCKCGLYAGGWRQDNVPLFKTLSFSTGMVNPAQDILLANGKFIVKGVSGDTASRSTFRELTPLVYFMMMDFFQNQKYLLSYDGMCCMGAMAQDLGKKLFEYDELDLFTRCSILNPFDVLSLGFGCKEFAFWETLLFAHLERVFVPSLKAAILWQLDQKFHKKQLSKPLRREVMKYILPKGFLKLTVPNSVVAGKLLRTYLKIYNIYEPELDLETNSQTCVIA